MCVIVFIHPSKIKSSLIYPFADHTFDTCSPMCAHVFRRDRQRSEQCGKSTVAGGPSDHAAVKPGRRMGMTIQTTKH